MNTNYYRYMSSAEEILDELADNPWAAIDIRVAELYIRMAELETKRDELDMPHDGKSC